jgi:hypothetical protein
VPKIPGIIENVDSSHPKLSFYLPGARRYFVARDSSASAVFRVQRGDYPQRQKSIRNAMQECDGLPAERR